MLSVLLLGAPQLLRDQLVLSVARRKSRALLYYLAAHPAPLTRDRVLALLWPDHERSAAQQILRTTLHGLRKVFGSSLITNDDSLALGDDVDIDVRRFASQLTSSTTDLPQLKAALDLYRGDFLDGFSIPDNPAFEDWAAAERERYRQLAVRGLTRLAELYEAAGNIRAGFDALVRAVSFEPLQEDLQRAAMRMQYLAGDRAGAIRRYEQLRTLLDHELGVPPMADTRALYDAIVTDTLPTQPAPAPRRARLTHAPPLVTSHLPFVGRDAEQEQLRSLIWSQQLLLIEGEPGIGKSRLAAEFISSIDGLILTGAARELDRTLPYQPVIEMVRGLLARPEWPDLCAQFQLAPVWIAELARLLPELTVMLPALEQPARTADESRLWEAVNQLLQALSRQHPLLIFLDDLHWADQSTLALLGYLVRRSTTDEICYLAATRPVVPRSPMAALAQTLTREGRLVRLLLTRLESEDTAVLARRLSATDAAALAEWLDMRSEGNPYILSELVRYARQEGALRPDGRFDCTVVSSSSVVPQTIYSLIQSRLAQLSDGPRRLLDAAVAAGRVFEFDVVARAAALSESVALDALDEVRNTGLIQPLDGFRYTFDHSLTMEVAYREVGEPRHRLMHRRVAEAMERVYRDRLDQVAGVLASHFAEGGLPDRAAQYAFRAGKHAASLAAWQEAITNYEQALLGSQGSMRIEVLMALGNACLQVGEAARGAEALRSALEAAHADGNAMAVDAANLALARALLSQARFGEAIALVQRARANGRPEIVVDAEFLWGTLLSIEGADLAAAKEHLEQAEQLLCQHGRHGEISLAQIRFELGSVAAQQGDLPRAIAYYREALAVAQDTNDETVLIWQILAHNNLAYHLHLLDDPSAIEYAHKGLDLAREKGTLLPQAYLLSTLGEIRLAQGELALAERYFEEGLALSERLSFSERIAGFTANLGRLALRRGQSLLAIHQLSTALAQADTLGVHHLAAQIRIWLAPLLPPAEAKLRLTEALVIAERGGRQRLIEEIRRLQAEE